MERWLHGVVGPALLVNAMACDGAINVEGKVANAKTGAPIPAASVYVADRVYNEPLDS